MLLQFFLVNRKHPDENDKFVLGVSCSSQNFTYHVDNRSVEDDFEFMSFISKFISSKVTVLKSDRNIDLVQQVYLIHNIMHTRG